MYEKQHLILWKLFTQPVTKQDKMFDTSYSMTPSCIEIAKHVIFIFYTHDTMNQIVCLTIK